MLSINYSSDPINYYCSTHTIKIIGCAYCGHKHEYKLHNNFYKTKINNKTIYFCSYDCKAKFLKERRKRLDAEEKLARIYSIGVEFKGEKYRGYKYNTRSQAIDACKRINGIKIIQRKKYFIVIKEKD